MDNDVDMLDRALMAAHEHRDLDALVTLYTKAANLSEGEGDIEAACFYLTQALVFALEGGSSEAVVLNTRLVNYGRAVPWPS
jgi:hypothetical protein